MYHLIYGADVVQANKVAERYLDRHHDSTLEKTCEIARHMAGLVVTIARLAIEVFADGMYDVHACSLNLCFL